MKLKVCPLFFSLILYSFLIPISILLSAEWTTYNKNNTVLESNNILCVAIDSGKTKWFGTDNGLVQFDGNNWKLYTNESEDNLADNYVKDVEIESYENQSLLWIATENGVSQVDVSNPESPIFTSLYQTTNSPLLNDNVNAINVDPGHVRWFGTFGGVSNFYNEIWNSYTTQNYWIDNDSVVSLASGPDSMVYIGTEGGGVSRLKLSAVDGVTSASTLNTTWTGFYEPDSGKLTSNNVYSILIEQNGNQWFGTDKGVAIHYSYNTLQDWRNFTQQDGLINDFVKAICKENENIFWFGTTDGVSRYDGISWTNYTIDDGLAGNNVRDIAIDHEGSVWFATEDGISVLSNTTTSITEKKSMNKFEFAKVSNFPNPFNMQTSIIFSLNTSSDVNIGIYNSNGEYIVSVTSGILAAGEHSYTWNGSNTSGSAVPSGVYFVQLLAGKQIKTHKIVVMK